jgi:hypothetical protein
MVLTKDFKDYNFPNKIDQTSNLRQLRIMESKCSDMKNEFDTLTNKISRQNKSIIDSTRNSKLSFPSQVNSMLLETNKTRVFLGNDLLAEDKIIEKEKQNETIEQ